MFTLSTFYNSKRKINDKKVTRRFNDSMSSLSNAKKISIKHSSGLHPGDSLFHFHASKLILHIPDTFFFLYIYHQLMLIFFAFDNDDMESSKRRVAFLSSIFLLTRMSKLIVIRSTFYKAAETQKQLLKLNAIQRFFIFF